MKRPILDNSYWKERLQQAQAKGQLHQAIFKCPLSQWQKIEEKHREILAEIIQPTDSILDVGCGWGRLLNLLPGTWQGEYCGVELSSDFAKLAKDNFLDRQRQDPNLIGGILHADIRELDDFLDDSEESKYHYAILISFRPMIKRELGDEVWQEMEKVIRNHAKKLLYLEYDVNDKWSIE